MWPPTSLLPHIVGGLSREYRRNSIFLEPDFGTGLFSSFSISGSIVETVICEVSSTNHWILCSLFIFAPFVSNLFVILSLDYLEIFRQCTFLSHQAHQQCSSLLLLLLIRCEFAACVAIYNPALIRHLAQSVAVFFDRIFSKYITEIYHLFNSGLPYPQYSQIIFKYFNLIEVDVITAHGLVFGR